MGGGQQGPSSLKSIHTYPTMMILGTVITGLKKIQKYINHGILPLGSADINICSLEISKFTISRDTDIIAFWYIILDFFLIFSWVFKDCLNKYGYNLDDFSKNGYFRPS